MFAIRLFLLCLAALVAVGCGGRDDAREQEAQAAYYRVYRDAEDSLEHLPDALAGYRALAEDYAGTESARKARVRVDQLQAAGDMLARAGEVPPDSLKAFYRGVLAVAPGYTPAVRRLGTFYYNETSLAGRSAAMIGSEAMADGVLRNWARQDSLWSDYRFRPTPDDRAWQDRLCRQATDVARMLESFRRYREALEVVNRGLEYGAGEEALAHARVFASFYTFRAARYEEAIALAKEALDFEHLSANDQGRAYHVIGLSYMQVHDRTKDVADLDAAIDALNAAVGADPSMAEARELLKALREQRRRLAS